MIWQPDLNCQTRLMSFILFYRGEKIIIIPWGGQWQKLPRVTFPKWNLKAAEFLSWSYFLLFGMFLRRPALVPEQQHSDFSSCQRRSLWAQSDLKTQLSKDVWSSAEQGREEVVVPPAEPWGCWQLWDNNSTFSCCQWSWKPIVLNRARSLPPQPQVEVSLVQRAGWTWTKSCSGYCCGKQINLSCDIFIYQEKQMGVGEQAQTSFNYYSFEKECA